MRLTRLYFCYGSILTSVLWLSVILIYFGIQQRQIHPVSLLGKPVAETSVPSLPDLDQLAIIRSPQDKLLRADGK